MALHIIPMSEKFYYLLCSEANNDEGALICLFRTVCNHDFFHRHVIRRTIFSYCHIALLIFPEFFQQINFLPKKLTGNKDY